MLKGRPDTNAENPQYLADMVECLAWLTPEEHAWLGHPRTGLQTICRFLPTPADVHEFIRAKHERLEAVLPASTTYRRLETEPGPWDAETDVDRKKQVVRQCLGYDPDQRHVPVKRELTAPTDEDLRNLRLKTPSAPASRFLIAKLSADGWPILPSGGSDD